MSFDFGALLKIHGKKHKSKPTQFVSMAGGVQKRLENISKHRKSNRLSNFDCNRNLPQSSKVDSNPAVIPVVITKVEHRRQQLEKWKKEKEQKKKELAAQKKKPFVAGVPHNPLNFVPPPPPRKVIPSSSGRVTRSQTRSQTAVNKRETTVTRQPLLKSFAPKNATFRAPKFENLTKLPILSSANTRDRKVTTFAFDPVIHKLAQSDAEQQTRSRTLNETDEIRMTRSAARELKDDCKAAKPVLKALPKYVQSSSSSENECSSNMQISSSTDDDLTAPVISSSSEKDSNKFYSSSTDNESAAKSLQSSSSGELEKEKQSPVVIGKSRKSLVIAASSTLKSRTPRKSVSERKSKVSYQEGDRLCTPKSLVPKSESSSEERLRSPKTPLDVSMTKEQNLNERNFSPCVTVSRGKDNARKEMKKKLEQGLLDEDASNMDDVDHFRRQLKSEIKRITEKCDIWDKIYEQVELPEAVQELVLAGVGQARLLVSQKMQQFASLVERCARPETGAALVTPADLHGFWDMLFMQVVNVDVRFKELEELKARDWSDEAPAPEACKTKPATKPNGKAAAKRNVKPKATGGTSRIREMIAAARKAKQQETQPLPTREDKTFEAGFFCVQSPIRSPSTPNRHNLLKAVLSSEAKRASASKNCASFAMLRASLHSKNVECDGVAPLLLTPTPQVILYATPGRSILKQTQDNTIKKIGEKSVKVVLFAQSDSEIDENSMPTDNIIQDLNTDTELSLDVKKPTPQKNKKNTRRSTRKNAVDTTSPSVPMTRNRRKSKQTPQEAEQRRNNNSIKNDFIEEIERANDMEEKQTPKRQSAIRSKTTTPILPKSKSNKSMLALQEAEPRPIRSCRKKNVPEEDINAVEEKQTPKRYSRRRKTVGVIEVMP